jgi:cell division protein FtsL
MKTNLAHNYDYDRSDAMTYYGGLFADHRAGSSVYGGLSYGATSHAEKSRSDRRRPDAREKDSRHRRFSHPAEAHISHAEKGIMIFVAVFIAAIFIGVIALEAYSVSIQHEINKTAAQTALVQQEIDDLYIAIEQGSNIAAIEKRAREKLNMAYPTSEQTKYAGDIEADAGDVDIAEDIRSKAYGT